MGSVYEDRKAAEAAAAAVWNAADALRKSDEAVERAEKALEYARSSRTDCAAQLTAALDEQDKAVEAWVTSERERVDADRKRTAERLKVLLAEPAERMPR